MKALLVIIATSTIAISGEITGEQLKQEQLNKQSGDYLVTDTVERISSKLDQNKFDVRLGRNMLTVAFSPDSDTSFTCEGDSICASKKRTSAKHFSGNSRYDKDIVMKVGDVASVLVKLSTGRVVDARLATEKDKIALKFKDAQKQPGGTDAVNKEIQARTLLIEINKLKQEIKTGVAGSATGTVTTQSMTTGGMSQGTTQTTYKFSAAEIEEKKQLLELKEAQLQTMLQ